MFAGTCDNCTTSRKESDMSREAFLLISSIRSCGGNWGLNLPIDVLRGSRVSFVSIICILWNSSCACLGSWIIVLFFVGYVRSQSLTQYKLQILDHSITIGSSLSAWSWWKQLFIFVLYLLFTFLLSLVSFNAFLMLNCTFHFYVDNTPQIFKSPLRIKHFCIVWIGPPTLHVDMHVGFEDAEIFEFTSNNSIMDQQEAHNLHIL